MSIARAQSSNSVPTAPTPSVPSTIAALNFNAAVLGTAEARKNLSVLQKKYAPREQGLQKLSDDVEAAKKSLNDNVAKLTEADRNQKLQTIGAKEKQLQRESEDFKNDSQEESQEAFQRVAQKVFSFLQEFSQQRNYAAVIERGTESSPVVWYTASNVDITDQIIKGYDAKYGDGESGLTKKIAPVRAAPGIPPRQP